METTRDHSKIIGWGVDADKSIRPNYPMWKIPKEGTGAHWSVPDQQPNFHDFHSNERPGPTHVFGTTVPPSGLSGMIRKWSFKYSEGSWAHWMGLMFADRVNVYEGILDDLLKGTMPGFLVERGWNMDKKFKTKRYYKVMTWSTLAVLAPLLYIAFRRND